MKNYIYLIAVLLLAGCTEPYKLQTNTFEEALVVEATITNELKKQEIKITKTYRLEEDGPQAVAGADVSVTDDNGNSYDFEAAENGMYVSTQEFQAAPNTNYHLNIVTSDGKSYSSSTEKLTTVSPITNVSALSKTVNGVAGVQIGASSFDPTSQSQYYRYTYEETYKVIAPYYSEFTAAVNQDSDPALTIDDEIVLVPRTGESKTCYSSAVSDKILVTSTNDLSEDRVADFPVRFIEKQDPILRNRYSILVTQYVQSLAAYTFYKTLSGISGSGGSILSQNQPGFFSGNIHSDENPDEKVIGFFEVSSVSKMRIFLNFADIFPGQTLPGYFQDCELIAYNQAQFDEWDPEGKVLRSEIINGRLLYFSREGDIYYMVVPACGDCTEISSNVIPPFWID